MVKTLIMVNIHRYVKDSLHDQLILFTHVYVCKKKETLLYLQEADNVLVLNRKRFCQQIDKKMNH